MNTTLDYPTLDDRQLVERHLAGDGGAFRQIVERYQAMVCALAVSACGDVARSEDLAQEVFVAAWKQLERLREPEKLRAWLCGIARNLIYSSLRRQGRTPTARAEELSAETPASGGSPQDHAISAEEAAMMWRTLEGIPETYREPMVLFYREHRSVPAVAATLEISEDAVRQRLTRGRAMLSERMASIVEETLEYGGPDRTFAQAVLAALPVGVTAATGGAAGKAATAAGTVGAALGKGGIGVKLLASVGVLPALMSGLTGSLDFRVRHDAAQTSEARRLITRGYLGFYGGMAGGMAGLALWTWVVRTHGPFQLWMVVTGVLLVITLPVLAGSVWSRRQFLRSRELTSSDQGLAGAKWAGPGYEYRSKRCLLGLPLLHVRTGRRGAPVKAWVAVGDVALGGLFATGGVAIAPVSMGGVTLGLVSFGGIALGGIALGGFAVGLLATGGMAVGLLASGGLMFARFTSERFTQVARVMMSTSMVAWSLAWLPPLLFIGWHRWRSRAAR